MNNILVRTLSGAVFISLILIPLFLEDPLISLLVLFVFMILGVIEFNNFFKDSQIIKINPQLNLVFSFAIGVLFLVAHFCQLDVAIHFILPILFLWNLTELWRKQEQPLLNIGVSMYGFLYVCVPLFLAMNMQFNETRSFPLLVGMFLLIWTNDTFAFLSGKFFGNHKLFERISPKKTWEGTIGGFIFTLVMAFVISYFFDPTNQFFWMVSVVIIVPAAIFGDLLESLFKRSLGVKDSGTIMPGHGGILDRFDATLYTLPFFYWWCELYFNA